MQEGWQGEEPYMHPESDKSNVAAVKHKYIHVGAQYEYDINRSITQLPFPHRGRSKNVFTTLVSNLHYITHI